ncbi:MAG TPA: hypothetical protein DD666_10095 [Advenella kashmirensis]|uniref:Uncharacterized protein n=1 Tax=Advenella kashmirensis TaxID=310575 RepID=A0A356LFF4_9BURK|nr:hypothetical protein [Advenella kashmirensis]
MTQSTQSGLFQYAVQDICLPRGLRKHRAGKQSVPTTGKIAAVTAPCSLALGRHKPVDDF